MGESREKKLVSNCLTGNSRENSLVEISAPLKKNKSCDTKNYKKQNEKFSRRQLGYIFVDTNEKGTHSKLDFLLIRLSHVVDVMITAVAMQNLVVKKKQLISIKLMLYKNKLLLFFADFIAPGSSDWNGET